MEQSKSIRLLIVEDNIADVLLMREALRDYYNAPVEVTSVTDGAEALALLNSGTKFDVLILDLNLPKVSGFEFLERYKTTYPPIVVFTSSWSDYDERRALKLGARQFVRKPISYQGYLDAVCGIVRQWGSEAATSSGTAI